MLNFGVEQDAIHNEGTQMHNVGYMVIPVVLFLGGIFVSNTLFSLGMKRVVEKEK
jgi:hypothetical protein